MNMQTTLATILLSCFILLPIKAVADEPATDPQTDTQAAAERQAAIAEAQRSLAEATRTIEEARKSLESSRQAATGEETRMREELSRAHRELRDASREVARAHRELELKNHEVERVRVINLGDRAVIGILLGKETQDGVELNGVSPDGPAERAGLRQNDVLTAIGGVDLTGHTDGGAREALFAAMDGAKAGEELAVAVSRDGEKLNLTVVPEQREPRSWQSIIRLPEVPPVVAVAPAAATAPAAPGEPQVVIERIEVPDIDEQELAIRIQEITDQAIQMEYMFIGDDGDEMEFTQEFELDDDQMSQVGEHAMREANVWFGWSQTRGLELASLNPELGKYFKADSGVLVIQAQEDNTYGLQSGDVIRKIGASEVNSPADFLRTLRDAEPGTEIELNIKRDRRDRTLKATVPENRLGMVQKHHPKQPPAPPAPPAVD